MTVVLLFRNVEVIVCSLSKVDDERIGYFPDIVDRMVGVDRKDVVPAGREDNPGVADIVDVIERIANESMFVRH